MSRKAWTFLAVGAIAVVIAHACGYVFGVGNQVTYFLEPLHRAHPELFTRDWLVGETTMYHSVWSIVASALFRGDPVVATAIVHAVLMIGTIVALYALVAGVAARAALAVFVLVVAWCEITGDRSLAGSYLWSGYLQPSTIATLGWIIALALHVRGKPLATGLALAAGGLFHVNFLLLGIGVFTAAEVVADRRGLPRRLAQLLAPQLVALVVLGPELVASAGAKEPELALWVLVRFHAPVHYAPTFVLHSLHMLVRWTVLAIAVVPVALQLGVAAPMRRLLHWCWITAALCTAAVPALMIPAVLPLTRLYVWRLGPFAQLAAMIVIAAAGIATLEDPARWRAQPWWRRTLAVAAAIWAIAAAPFDPGAAGGWVLAVGAAAIVAAIVIARARRWLPCAAAVASLAFVLVPRWPVIAHPALASDSGGSDTDALYAWARTTPVDTVFFTPPDLSAFRFFAQRAIIADFKSPPLLPDELVAWYRRLGTMVGDDHIRSVPDARAKWAASSGSELLARARGFSAQYLVLDRAADAAGIASAPVFTSGRYVVYSVAP